MAKTEIKNGSITWIDVVNAEEKDISYLSKKFGFHELDLEDCMSNIQRPKIDQYEDYLFMVTHFPRYFKGSRRLVISEVDIFIGKNYLITVHNGNQKLLVQLFEKCSNDKEFFKEISSGSPGLLLHELMTTLYSNCFKMIDKIYERIEVLDDKIFSKSEKPRDLIREFSALRQEIINFRRIIKPQKEMLDTLEHTKAIFLIEDVDVYFDDIGDMVEKIWDLLENQKEIVDSLISTYESLVSNQTNDIIKLLTIFSVIILPLTLLSGIYGMNIRTLPFAETDFSFMFVGGLMISVVILMLLFFNKKRWL
ncbi:MAG: magnesium/cobalt transporter CorA [bacterium]|nr:magnesium/cobalt transporter CorA [bacterium]